MIFRSPTPDDLRFVRSTWLQSYASSDFAKLCTPSEREWFRKDPERKRFGIGSRVYFDGQRDLIERLLIASVVLVAEGDAGNLDGFACGWPRSLLHYVYVRLGARKRGVARALLDALYLQAGERVTYTHRAAGIRGSPRGWTYDPSPTSLLPKGETMKPADRHRVKYVQLAESVPLRHGPSGEKNGRAFLRAEQDRSVAHFDEDTGLIYIQDRSHEGNHEVHVLHVSGVRDMILYPKGVIPEWERLGEKAAHEMGPTRPIAAPDKGAAA
jgi:GNAT superfamily N-acetyltransferase